MHATNSQCHSTDKKIERSQKFHKVPFFYVKTGIYMNNISQCALNQHHL